MKNLLPVVFIALIAFSMAAGAFFWFQYRPSEIYKYCNWKAGEKVGWSINRLKDRYENEYAFCLHEKGLK